MLMNEVYSRSGVIGLGLGTVQFGLAYGVAGRGSPVPEREISEILELAVANGVRTLDTAPAYGSIESRLRRLIGDLTLSVVSKIPAIPDKLSPCEAAQFALRSARASAEKIGPALRGLLFHRVTDFTGLRGDAIEKALECWARDNGISLGISGYGPDDLLAVKRERAVAIAQIPGNALDQRLVCAAPEGFAGVEIHTRSAFLQGLLLMPQETAGLRVPAATQALETWHDRCRTLGLSPLRAALAIAKSFASVSSLVVVGVDSLRQCGEVFESWTRVEAVSATDMACFDEAVIDPRQWPIKIL